LATDQCAFEANGRSPPGAPFRIKPRATMLLKF
jgi:hypothetical protein